MSLARTIAMLAVIIGAIVIIESSILGWRIHKGSHIALNSLPFAKENRDARARILVVGDSTGVGTGADSPLDSLAGRVYQDFPQVEIVNRAANGARAADVIDQLQIRDNGRFDLVMIQVGGNDILRFTELPMLHDTISVVLDLAAQKGDKVMFLSTGNVGLAPAFFPPISWLYTWRTRKVRAIFMEVAARARVEYVDLFKEKDEDPFLEDPEVCYAADLLHPGSEGYRLWYQELLNQTSLTSFLRNGLSR